MNNKFLLKVAMLAFVAVFASVRSFAASNYVTVTTANGAAKSFALSDYPVVTFTTENVVITAGSESVEYPLSDYVSFGLTETDNTVTGINAAPVATNNGRNSVFSFGNAVSATGLKAGSRLAVYTIDGRLVGSAKVSDNGNASIPLNAGKGVFIVKSDGKSFKFIKR